MPVFSIILMTRSVGALRAPTSSWRPFGPLDFVLISNRKVCLDSAIPKVVGLKAMGGPPHQQTEIWKFFSAAVNLSDEKSVEYSFFVTSRPQYPIG